MVPRPVHKNSVIWVLCYIASFLCMYVSEVKSGEDLDWCPASFPCNCKLHDVFHSVSPVFMKYVRNKALFVLLVHKMVEMLHFSVSFCKTFFVLCSPFLFDTYTLAHCFGDSLITPGCFLIWGKFKSTSGRLESWRGCDKGRGGPQAEIWGSKTMQCP